MAHITVEGRLGSDVEMRFTPQGKAVASFSLAEQHRKKQGNEWVDDTTSWYRVTLWGRAAENAAETFTKGQPVIVTGDLKIAEFETRDGGKGKAAEVTARSVGAIATGQPTGARSSGGGYGHNTPGGGQAGDPWASDAPAPF